MRTFEPYLACGLILNELPRAQNDDTFLYLYINIIYVIYLMMTSMMLPMGCDCEKVYQLFGPTWRGTFTVFTC